MHTATCVVLTVLTIKWVLGKSAGGLCIAWLRVGCSGGLLSAVPSIKVTEYSDCQRRNEVLNKDSVLWSQSDVEHQSS